MEQSHPGGCYLARRSDRIGVCCERRVVPGTAPCRIERSLVPIERSFVRTMTLMCHDALGNHSHPRMYASAGAVRECPCGQEGTARLADQS